MPDLSYSERNLLDAVRDGKTITEAELSIVLDRLKRERAAVGRYREALERIAGPTCSDPIHREYWAVKRLQRIATDALGGTDGD